MRTPIMSILAEIHHMRVFVISMLPCQVLGACQSLCAACATPIFSGKLRHESRREMKLSSPSGARSKEVLALPVGLTINLNAPCLKNKPSPMWRLNFRREGVAGVEPTSGRPYVKTTLCKPMTSGSMPLKKLSVLSRV